MTSDEIEKMKMDLLDAKENVRYHKQEYDMLAIKYNKMVKQKNREITNLKLKNTVLENENKKMKEELNLKEKQEKLF